ncbi:MAG: hypothetical protein ER33_05560 [Cyanobium sp. CACIAM 14]|nr:MAG: hypothetical protein ER33_05560 [Cyanobium sp. CACIAM 14]
MLPEEYFATLPLAERLERTDSDLARNIYSPEVMQFLQEGVVIFPQVIEPQLLDHFENDLNGLPGLAATSLLHGMIGIDGSTEHYEARVLRNLTVRGITDFRQAGPGLKLTDLHRYFESARSLAFAGPIIRFLAELFGSAPALIQSLTFWKSSEQPLHQDFAYVHHHSLLGHLAAAWIPLENIHADAGPLVYYKGSHRLSPSQFFQWQKDEILCTRDDAVQRGRDYGDHLQGLIREQHWEPSIYLPRRGDLLIWHGALIHGGSAMRDPALTRRSYVCHYTAAAAHKALAAHRVGGGYDFSEPPSLPESLRPRRWPNRVAGKAGRLLKRVLPGRRQHG